ncbi:MULTISPECIES: LacI family DNA-binding transcriptional regulator [unclassified Paenibacillus]|uniref:LacI family DNA-binding transcriptional regulator n=1 Tax=unclassified Paenibacillus TaxID=185978 RepID=UPI0013E2C7D9|nr:MULTISPECIES: LacI family DNA-binding transcriptional regulator [unclassified Paenibacillus]MCM3174576.1 LacI family transcriptional regulator [Paenibacillus sp. MER 99-2]
MNIKMTDIAKKAGVSLATVGRVLHNNGYVSKEKRKMIEQIIKETGYVPNKIAQGLKASRSNIFGHLTLFNDNMQYKGISSAINTSAVEKGYQVLTLTYHEDSGEEEHQINELIGHRVEGVFITSNCSIPEKLISRLSEEQIPVVMIERTYDMPHVDRIVVNDYLGSQGAVLHFIEKGHRRIGFIGSELTQQVEIDRYQGYLKALEEVNVIPNKDWIKHMPDYSLDFGRQAMNELLNSNSPPSAVFMTSDIFACGVLQTLYDQKLRVPEDISLIGYDNTLSALLSPPLTSVGLPYNEIGEHAVELLLRRTKDFSYESCTIEVEPFLMDRRTVSDLSM